MTSEVQKGIKETKCNTTPGEDLTTAENFKHLRDDAIQELTKIFNVIYSTGKLPECCFLSTLVIQRYKDVKTI